MEVSLLKPEAKLELGRLEGRGGFVPLYLGAAMN